MAKEIKAIKCPNCGSVEKTELKPSFYKCNNCQTEYFLDDNDVNINYNHNFNHNHPNALNNNEKTLKHIGITVGVILFVVIIFSVITAIFSSNKPDRYSAYSTSVEKEELDSSFSASRYSSFSFLRSGTSEPVIVMLESRRYNNNKYESKNGTYLAFYNPVKKKLLSEQKISETSMSTVDFKVRTFSDGNIYMVNDRATLLKLNKDQLKTEEIGRKFFEANKDLQIGVATVDFVYEDYGDGLILLTNDGKKRYYYPLIQKLYTEDQYYRANNGFRSVLPRAKNKTIHIFTSESMDYPEENLQLLQITYKDNGAGPKDVPDRLKWGKDYGGSGIFTERDPYKKVLVSDYDIERGRILSWKDLTPGRLYFSPTVLVDNGSTLIIQFRADANTKSAYKLQQISRPTGAVEWTSSLTNESFKSLLGYKDGYVGVNSNNEFVTLDKKGNNVSRYKIE